MSLLNNSLHCTTLSEAPSTVQTEQAMNFLIFQKVMGPGHFCDNRYDC